MARMNWEKARREALPVALEPGSVEGALVTVRCRGCGHLGKVGRRRAQAGRLKCSKCGWKGAKPNA